MEKENPSPEPTDTLAVVEASGKTVRYACGHAYASKWKMDFYGTIAEPSDEMLAKRLRCGDCEAAWLKAKVIRCGLCGHAILPGEGVALYANEASSFKKEWTTTVDDGAAVIGCLRMGCCPSGGYFAGHWTEDGFKPAFVHGSAIAEAFATGKVVVGDVSDPSSIGTIDIEKEKS